MLPQLPLDSVSTSLPVPGLAPFDSGFSPIPPLPPSKPVNRDDNQAASFSLPELMPVRMLNEFAYCPRLGYLEWIQGEWADNMDTREGTFGHRNVDKPDKKNIPSAGETDGESDGDAELGPSEPLHTRSIMLSSEKEGLIAKLDLLELDGSTATPVDYKRGKLPGIPEGAYEPERVQLCAQGLILRDNGYRCDEGTIYFIASKKRVSILFDEPLVERTRELMRQFRETAVRGICPLPLEDSPKCTRCALVGICLPDETNLLKRILDEERTAPQDADDERDDEAEVPIAAQKPQIREKTETVKTAIPKRSIPTLQQARPFYVQTQGAVVGKSGERLTVKFKGELLTDMRMLDVSQVCIFGNIMLSAQAISELLSRNIPILHFSYGAWFHGVTSGLEHKNVELRIRQHQVANDPLASTRLARHFIAGKIRNCRTLLMRHLKKEDTLLLRDLKEWRRRVLLAENAASLLGLEGMAAKRYFPGFFSLLPDDAEFEVSGRNRRPPRDPVNAVLSFVYSLLTKELAIAVQGVGFDPMRGFLHMPRYGRPSLALDLAEEFRPIIADSVAMTVFNNGEVNPGSFIRRLGYVAMSDAARKSVIQAFERRMTTEITHPIFGYKICYRRVLEVQARLLARHVLGELDEYIPFTVR